MDRNRLAPWADLVTPVHVEHAGVAEKLSCRFARGGNQRADLDPLVDGDSDVLEGGGVRDHSATVLGHEPRRRGTPDRARMHPGLLRAASGGARRRCRPRSGWLSPDAGKGVAGETTWRRRGGNGGARSTTPFTRRQPPSAIPATRTCSWGSSFSPRGTYTGATSKCAMRRPTSAFWRAASTSDGRSSVRKTASRP